MQRREKKEGVTGEQFGETQAGRENDEVDGEMPEQEQMKMTELHPKHQAETCKEELCWRRNCRGRQQTKEEDPSSIQQVSGRCVNMM